MAHTRNGTARPLVKIWGPNNYPWKPDSKCEVCGTLVDSVTDNPDIPIPLILRQKTKIQLTFKTPDLLDQLTPTDKELVTNVLHTFIKYNEYITIEFDTETQTAKVIEV
jgi:hypothetical protein